MLSVKSEEFVVRIESGYCTFMSVTKNTIAKILEKKHPVK